MFAVTYKRFFAFQVALGKAHAIALTSFGQVYTFGINNKSQCGREFGYVKESKFEFYGYWLMACTAKLAFRRGPGLLSKYFTI